MTDVGVEDVISTIDSKEVAAWLPAPPDVCLDDTVLISEVACPAHDIDARLAGATPAPVDPTRSDIWSDTALVFLNSPGGPNSYVLFIP